MLFLIIIFIYLLFMLYILRGWRKLKVHELGAVQPAMQVSVIIPLRNEAENIETCLTGILQQDISKDSYEIILVNDHSTDHSKESIQKYLSDKVSWIELPEGQEGKKAALTTGINQAKNELIITTDADCTYGNQWLRSMLSYFEKHQPNLLVGPLIIEGKESSESIGLGITTAAMCYYQHPIMCNGANLAFTKTVFEKVKGYQGYENIPGGDDVFLMQKVKKQFPGTIHFLKAKEAIVKTKPTKNFLQQRIRWASKALRVADPWNSFIGLLILLTNINVLIAVIFFFKSFHLFFLLPFIVKTIIDFFMIKAGAYFYGRPTHLLEVFLAQIKNMLYIPLVAIMSLFGKYSWKGRGY